MKNQQGRQKGNRDFNSYQGGRDQRDDNRNRNDYDNRGYGGSRGNNSGYEDQDMNSSYGSQGRRGENYGYGAQEYNEGYRNFSTQGRNSGLGNQGGYSSYGSPSERDNDWNRSDHWNRNESDWDRNPGSRENEGWRDHQGTEWNSGRNSYRPYREDEYQPGSGSGGRNEKRYASGDTNSQGFGTSYQDSSRDRRNQDNIGMGTGFSSGSDYQSHRGKGPKGYQRSDERIEEAVNDRLTDDHMLDASEIEAKVSKGEVTLTGSVSSKDSKRRAEEIAEAVSGVSNVENRIRVTKDRDRNSSDSNQENGSRSRPESATEKTKAKQPANGAHV